MDIVNIVQECSPSVAPATMLQIIHIESNTNSNAIGSRVIKNGQVFYLSKQPNSKAEAIVWAHWLNNNGYRFDAGIAQISSVNFKKYELTPDNVFDPCTNIRVASKILEKFYNKAAKTHGFGQRALLAAISAYNTGNFQSGFKNGYVLKVQTAKPYIKAKSNYKKNLSTQKKDLLNSSTEVEHFFLIGVNYEFM